MYEHFFGLKEKPFNVTADPAFFFLSKKHNEAFSHLVFGIDQRKGIMVITGEIGTGKTTLCRTLLSRLDKKTKTAFILNPNFSALQLLQIIVEDFGLHPTKKSKLYLVSELNKFLLHESNIGNNVVLIIDESQNLSARQLEQIRLLSNLETEKEKLLQIVLVGQPELQEKLGLTQLRQLNQRVSVRYHMQPLDSDEIEEYIVHRLKVAGSNGTPNFTKEAITSISSFSSGTPRLINIICDRALLAGFVKETKELNNELIQKCIKEIHEYYS
ncbi:ExeA family protein [Candidatus Omnitrophota bacterium]